MRHLTCFIGTLALIVSTAGTRPAAAQTLSRAQFDRLTAAAKTAADHRALAAHYRAHAEEHTADAASHERIATEARSRQGDDEAWELARNADHYAQHSREAAEALRDLAALHSGVAEQLGAGTAAGKAPCCGQPSAKPATDAAVSGAGRGKEHKH
jgi:hypothetical protein